MFNEIVNDQDFAKLIGELDSVKYGNHFYLFLQKFIQNPITFALILLLGFSMNSDHDLDSIHVILLRNLSI